MATIREMRGTDLEVVAELCKELGYPVPPEELKMRFALLSASKVHALFVAESPQKEIIGWAQVASSLALTAQIRCEIIGIVVTQTERRKGVGRKLVAHCEAWGKERNLGHIRVRSQALRESAHEFYNGLGYELKKIQNVFVKRLEN